MKRAFMGFLAGFGLACLLLLTGIPGVLPNVTTRMDQRAIADWRAARLMMLADVAVAACATQADLRRAATARGWEVEVVNPVMEPMPDRLSDARWALRVHTQPPRPFVDEAGDIYGFDATDCLMP